MRLRGSSGCPAGSGRRGSSSASSARSGRRANRVSPAQRSRRSEQGRRVVADQPVDTELRELPARSRLLTGQLITVHPRGPQGFDALVEQTLVIETPSSAAVRRCRRVRSCRREPTDWKRRTCSRPANGSSNARLRAHTVTGRPPGARPARARQASCSGLSGRAGLCLERASTSRSRSWSRGANGFASRHLSHRIGSGPTVFRWRTSSRPARGGCLPRPARHRDARRPAGAPSCCGAVGDDERHAVRLAAGAAQTPTHGPEGDEHDQLHPAIEHVVVGRQHDRRAHRGRPEDREQPQRRLRVAPQTAMPTTRFQPKCRLGNAAYWLVNPGGCRARYASECKVTVSIEESARRGRHR